MNKPCIIGQPNHFICSIWTNIPYIYIRNFLLTGYCGATGQHQEQLTLQLKVRYYLRLIVWCLIKEVSTILCMLFFLCVTCRNLSSPYYIIWDMGTHILRMPIPIRNTTSCIANSLPFCYCYVSPSHPLFILSVLTTINSETPLIGIQGLEP